MSIGILLAVRPLALYTSAIHLVHFIRGLIGLCILNNTPTIQELIDSAPMEDRVMHMSEISAAFSKHIQSKGLAYMEGNRGKLTMYAITTVLCLLTDIGLLGYTVWLIVQGSDFVYYIAIIIWNRMYSHC